MTERHFFDQLGQPGDDAIARFVTALGPLANEALLHRTYFRTSPEEAEFLRDSVREDANRAEVVVLAAEEVAGGEHIEDFASMPGHSGPGETGETEPQERHPFRAATLPATRCRVSGR